MVASFISILIPFGLTWVLAIFTFITKPSVSYVIQFFFCFFNAFQGFFIFLFFIVFNSESRNAWNFCRESVSKDKMQSTATQARTNIHAAMMAVSVLMVFVIWSLSVSEVISQCPPSSGIYLRHNGNCYTNGSYFWDQSIRPTPLECVLPGATLNGGQWIGPNGVVPCDSGNNANVQCNTGSGANLSVHVNPSGYLGTDGDGQYMCCLPTACSDPNTNIIFANIFNFAEIKSFTVADLPSDMTVYPQEYKLNCTKIGHWRYNISMSIGSTALANYTNCDDRSITDNCPGTVLVSSTHTVRYTVNIRWDGMNVSSGSISQSTTGDQMYQCRVADHPDGNEVRIRNVIIKVPATAPSSLTEVNKTATTITVSWTALDSSDADGYVVNVTSDTDTMQTVQAEGNSNNIVTVNGLIVNTTYNVTVRAYQQLLGPATSAISVQTSSIYCSSESIDSSRGTFVWPETDSNMRA
uniref:Fibronectin type-III domain-containing protein n=1 Tax=Amphimedon queenslandica TaxID=400682 RepID=A0A1X7UN04_AMPQE